jgi:uncharacterized protein YjbI with pentapeptide repeats
MEPSLLLDAPPSLDEIAFVGADHRGADLGGRRISYRSLRGIDLRDAHLRQARLAYVDLSGAQLDGADLGGTFFDQVRLGGTSLRGADLSGATWQLVDAADADFTGAVMRHANLRNCSLERARLDDVDAPYAALSRTNADRATFRGARLAQVNTSGSTFVDADFTDARDFALSREILTELFRREVGTDFTMASLVGAIGIGERWCFPDWREVLARHPEYVGRFAAFCRTYPESGLREAMRMSIDTSPAPAGTGRRRSHP